MWNPFKYLTRKYWRNRRLLRTIKTVAESVAIIKNYQQAGLLHWHPRERALLIEQSLATVYLTKPDLWHAFMKMVIHTICDDLRKEAYTRAVKEAEYKARRQVLRDHPVLTNADKTRIAQESRQHIAQIDPAQLTIEDFFIYIIRADVASAKDSLSNHSAGEGVGELVAVGHYTIDGDFAMSLYDDIKKDFATE